MVWLVNAVNGKVMANFIGHEDEVIMAKFTRSDGGKQIISCSADCSIKVWSPLQAECLKTIKNGILGHKHALPFHDGAVQCFDLHPTKTLVMSGGADGSVFGSNYASGESAGQIGKHKDSVESVALSEEMQMGVSAGIDAMIIIYDLKTLSIRHKISPTAYGGFTKVQFSSFPIKLPKEEGQSSIMCYAASTLGNMFVIDVRTGEVAYSFKGHVAPINHFVEINNTQQLVTAGDDNQCNVF